MTPENIVLVLVLLLLSASALVGSLLLSRGARETISRRMQLIAAPGVPVGSRADGDDRNLVADTTNELARAFFSAGSPFRWGMKAGLVRLVALGTVAALAISLALGKLLHLPFALVAAGGVASFYLVPRFLLKHEQFKVEQEFLVQFPDALDMIVRMVRAGMPMTAAIRSTATESTGPVNEQLTLVADQLEIGMMFEEAMTSAGARIGLPDFRFFAVAVALQHATGGNIAATLEVLSDIIRKRKIARSKATSTTAEVRMSAIILACLPFVVIGGLALFAPNYLRPLIVDSRGNVIIGAAVGLLLTGYLVMRKMMLDATRL
jgi:tight adherence protein B